MNRHRPARLAGAALALVGALLVLLAYYALPVITIPLIGSLTAPTLGGLAPEASSLILVPLVPIVAVLAAAVAVWLLATTKPAARRIGAGVLVVAAAFVILAYAVPLLRLQSDLDSAGLTTELGLSAATFTGIGFWAGLFGAALTAVGGLLEFGLLRSRTPSTV